MIVVFRFVVLLLLAVSLVGCGSSAPKVEESGGYVGQAVHAPLTHQLVALNYPLAFFTEQLVGDLAQVECVLPPADADAEKWVPSREQIARMQQADLIIANGSSAPFARWLPHVTLPDDKFVATANDGLLLSDMIAVKDIRIVHSHGPEGEHSHPTMVAHSWLDPAMATKQMNVIAERLKNVYPDEVEALEANRVRLQERLAGLSKRLEDSKRLRETHESKESIAVVFSANPNLKFLTRAIGLDDQHFDWFHPPTKAQAQERILEISEQGSTGIMLWPYPPSDEVAQLFESRGFKNVVVSPLAQPPSGVDYFSVMETNIASVLVIRARSASE